MRQDCSGRSARDEQDESGRQERPDRHERFSRRRHGNDVVSIGRDSDLPAGERADSVVSILGSSTSAGEARDVVSILGTTRVTGPVQDSAVAILGNTIVDSAIHGDVVAVLGNVELGPHADVEGDVVAVGGKVLRDPSAVIHGDVHSLGAAARRLRLAAAVDRSLPVLWPAPCTGIGNWLGVGSRARLPGAVCLPRAAVSTGGRRVRTHRRHSARTDGARRAAHPAADALAGGAAVRHAHRHCRRAFHRGGAFLCRHFWQGRDAGVAGQACRGPALCRAAGPPGRRGAGRRGHRAGALPRAVHRLRGLQAAGPVRARGRCLHAGAQRAGLAGGPA